MYLKAFSFEHYSKYSTYDRLATDRVSSEYDLEPERFFEHIYALLRKPFKK